ncbi:unnamed protein product, partial [Oppiella nova]
MNMLGTGSSSEGHLRDHAKQKYIGTSFRTDAFSDQKYLEILGQEFNCVSCEALIWGFLEPVRGQYNWGPADNVVAYGEQHNMTIRGHNLIWHELLPTWIAGLEGKKAELEQVMKDHINTVVGHFKVINNKNMFQFIGKIYAWDVVNEAIDEVSGELRDSIWSRTFNYSFIEEAFRTAHAADPNAKLYINE